MTLRSALDDYKRTRDETALFPGERRTLAGHFSGTDDRLVHVGRDGSLRDFSYPLSGLYGIDRSRFGVSRDDETVWFDDCDPVAQSYADDTALVETAYDLEGVELERSDLTTGSRHVTHVVAPEGSVDALEVFVAFAPGGRDDRIGQLVFEDDGVVEVYHRDEHDFLASASGFETVVGQLPERLPDVLGAEPVDFPASDETGQYEDGRLGGYVYARVPLENGTATVVTDLRERPDRDAVVEDLVDATERFDDRETVRSIADDQFVPGDGESVVDDLRVLGLLSADVGSRIAGPDFDPHYEYSGGYGYTWFRDDAEISRFLLESDAELDLALESWHDRSAAFYERTQREDGSWPHRVWPDDGSLAPGWANDRIRGEGVDYQADQTGSVLSYLAAYAAADESRVESVEPVVECGLASLDDTLGADGLPIACQNAWENMAGRFTHTAATFLHAYAEIAAAPFSSEIREHAAAQARIVYDSLDQLWVDDRGVYALRAHEGELDDRLDSSTLALVDAHRAYAEVASLDDRRRERLHGHLETTLDGLSRETDAVRGLIRFEGDDWRVGEQGREKVWTVSTAWGANAAAVFGTLTGDEAFYDRSRALLDELLPDGSLCLESGYLPEQVFDDGTPDSATPLGWPHALRLATVAHLEAVGELDLERLEAGIEA
ncbi:glucan 1,4-alpha-glucosidase [Halobacteria archaeon AArc-m2/3/4]|uniref:Glucan 1,4-alpha-glucosidase n=1 Tax=Natronoglomus mannanivorans TaxID=2979990 RepID=A0ABT2Q9T5_9EURY|nr:glucan 1,4-alpha-glucosidase [Halobacteria archaeon AArc-m2/3/4]